jgi:hypothetical protein
LEGGEGLSESDIQIQVVDYCNLLAALCGFIFWSTPNEAMGEAKTGAGLGRMARLKRMGLRSGVSDLVFVKDGRVYFLEMKRPGGKISDNQAIFGLDATHAGAKYEVAWSFDQALKILKEWSIIP